MSDVGKSTTDEQDATAALIKSTLQESSVRVREHDRWWQAFAAAIGGSRGWAEANWTSERVGECADVADAALAEAKKRGRA